MTIRFTLSRLRRQAAALAGAAALLVVLAACGGSAAEPFRPTRLVALGDEMSVLTSDGRKYSVNAFKSDGTTLDCAANPLWIQSLASAFGLTFAECNPNAVAQPTAQTLALPQAQVAFDDGSTANTLVAQVDAFLASAPGEDVLVTILIGTNDIVEQYGKYPGTPEDQLLATLGERGRQVAAQINRVALAGPAVLAVTVPDLGLSPFGIAQKAANTDTDRAALLTRLTDAFNSGMRLEMINDGRMIGVVFGDQEVRDIVRDPPVYGFANVSAGVCAVALPGCYTNTLVANGNAINYLWADGLRFSPGGQARLGLLAQVRALNNPF
jgi:phospholipase/lecithinase/hemolysin